MPLPGSPSADGVPSPDASRERGTDASPEPPARTLASGTAVARDPALSFAAAFAIFSAMNDLRPTIVRLLSNLGSAREIQLYLERFSRLDAVRFAVVKVGGAVLRDELGALVSSLAFLQQVGLTPIVVHGAGPQLDEELAAAGIEKRVVDGLRYTSPQGLATVRRVLQLQNLRLVEALSRPRGYGPPPSPRGSSSATSWVDGSTASWGR
jgi:hypothetical protein